MLMLALFSEVEMARCRDAAAATGEVSDEDDGALDGGARCADADAEPEEAAQCGNILESPKSVSLTSPRRFTI